MTIFQKIIDRQIPAKIVHETDEYLAFRDINPQAPTHVLCIPKRRVAGVSRAADADGALLGGLMLFARDVAKQEGLASYRLVINDGEDAGQTVDHIHVHVLGGRRLGWPPG